MRWQWEVLQARTKVPPIGQPVSGSPFGSGRRRHRELIDVGEWGRFLVLRDVSMGVAGRPRPGQSRIRKEACPDQWDECPAHLGLKLSAPALVKTAVGSAGSAPPRPTGQRVKCLQVRARLRISIRALHLEHDCAGDADPLHVGIADSLCGRLAAIRAGDRCRPGRPPQHVSDEPERSLHSCRDLQRLVDWPAPPFPSGMPWASRADSSSLNDQVVEGNVIRSARLVLAQLELPDQS